MIIIIITYFEMIKENMNVMDLFDKNEMVKICAPMVRYSKYVYIFFQYSYIFHANCNLMENISCYSIRFIFRLQFRSLVKLYDCDLCFSSMILADSFHKSEKARRHEFKTSLGNFLVLIY